MQIKHSSHPHQNACHANSSTEDAISLTHLKHPNAYIQMLLINLTTEFNKIIPNKLQDQASTNFSLPGSLLEHNT